MLSQNKVYIYRGQPYERYFDFTTRMENQFPNAKVSCAEI